MLLISKTKLLGIWFASGEKLFRTIFGLWLKNSRNIPDNCVHLTFTQLGLLKTCYLGTLLGVGYNFGQKKDRLYFPEDCSQLNQHSPQNLLFQKMKAKKSLSGKLTVHRILTVCLCQDCQTYYFSKCITWFTWCWPSRIIVKVYLWSQRTLMGHIVACKHWRVLNYCILSAVWYLVMLNKCLWNSWMED